MTMNKKKGLQGLDGLNLEYSINLDNAKHLYIPAEELKNEAEHTVVKIDCVGGKIRAYVNAVHALRPNNIKPLGVADTIKLELVKSKVVEFIKTYLQKNLGNQYSEEYIDNLKVTQLECNLTLKCCGSATPSAVISLFDLAFDETGIRRKRKQKSEYEKINKSWVYYKPKEYKIKAYDKTLEQHEKGNPLVENNLLRIEVVFVDRSLKRMYGEKRTLSDVLTKQSIEVLCREYKRVLTEDIIENNIKPCLDYCVQSVFESLTYSESGKEISETVARHKELIVDIEVLRRALKRWYKFRHMNDNTKQIICHYRKKNLGLPEDVIKTIKLFRKSS